MAFNILESVENVFSEELISKIASALGESLEGVENIMRAAVPYVLTAIVHKSTTEEGAGDVLNRAKIADNSGILNNPEDLVNDDTSAKAVALKEMANNMFGDKLQSLTNLITNYSEARMSCVRHVLSMAVPAVLAEIGRQAIQDNLSASELSSMLQNQKSQILAAVPYDMNLNDA